MMLSRLRLGVGCLALFTLVVLASAVPSFAQQTLGSLNGTVLDPSGAAIADAAVKVTDTAINVTESTTSQRTGFFQIFNLPIGTYEVSVSHDGFETTRLSGVVIREAQASTVDVSLKVGQVSESVEVIANPMLNATDASNGFTMDTQQIMPQLRSPPAASLSSPFSRPEPTPNSSAASTPTPDWATRISRPTVSAPLPTPCRSTASTSPTSSTA
jgi:hypothetical protein